MTTLIKYDPEERTRAYDDVAQFHRVTSAYIRMARRMHRRPPGVEQAWIDQATLPSNEQERLNYELPRHAINMLDELREEHADDPYKLMLVNLLPLDTASRGRRMLEIKRRVETEKARQFGTDLAMARQGKIRVGGEYVDIDWPFPRGGIPNRHGPGRK